MLSIWTSLKICRLVKSRTITIQSTVNSLPNNKILDWAKLKAFADNKINVNEKKFKFVLGGVETLWEKEKMLGISIFSFSHNVFKRPLIQGR